MTPIYPFFMTQSLLLGMLSWSQFLFEFLALGFLVALAWARFVRELPTLRAAVAGSVPGPH